MIPIKDKNTFVFYLPTVVLFKHPDIILNQLYYKYFSPWEFFIPVLVGGLSLEYKLHQVSSGLQISPEYSE